MADNSNIMTLLGGLFQQASATYQQVNGQGIAAKTAIAGGNLEAANYNNYAQSAVAMTAYNTGLEQADEARQESLLGQNLVNTLSSNRALVGASGLAASSQSAMSVANQNMNQAMNTLVQMRNTSLQKISQIQYAGALESNRLQNQAQSAQFEANTRAVLANYQSGLDLSSGLGKIVTSGIEGLAQVGGSS